MLAFQRLGSGHLAELGAEDQAVRVFGSDVRLCLEVDSSVRHSLVGFVFDHRKIELKLFFTFAQSNNLYYNRLQDDGVLGFWGFWVLG